MLTARFRALALILVAARAAVPTAATASAESSRQNAAVTMSDAGFAPPSVTIPAGGTVNWTNRGSAVHTATSIGGAPFDSGGVSSGQSASFTFATPGVYAYSSATDCLNGNSSQTFRCGLTYTVTVLGTPGQPSPEAAGAGTPLVSSPTQVQDQATVTISDSGFSPKALAITTRGSVLFVNTGTVLHTAASGSAPEAFDSGGLAPGQSTVVVLTTPGTYGYTSSSDCLNGNVSPGFDCTASSITVTQAPVGAVSAQAAGTGTVFSYIKDESGYQSPALTVAAGSTVTWLNLGKEAHAVDSDPGAIPQFHSGGLGTGGAFSVTFTTPGTYSYHSSADPTAFDAGGRPVAWRFSGTITVR